MRVLTGHTRHRKTLFGKLVLQVQIEKPTPTPVEGEEGKSFTAVAWVDARAEDLLTLERRGKGLNAPGVALPPGQLA